MSQKFDAKANRWLIVICGSVFFAVVLYSIYYPFSPAGIQSRNMRRAAGFIPTVRNAISNDSRFKYIEFNETTAMDGALNIRGYVRNGDLADLRRRVESLSPPTKVQWFVRECDEAEFKIWTETDGLPNK